MKNRNFFICVILFCLVIGVIVLTNFSNAVQVEINAFFMENTNFNIWGDGVQTTYGNKGYSTVLKVGTTEYEVKNGSGSGNSVTCQTILSYVSEKNYVKITYNVKNNSGATQTIGVATHADVQVNKDDYAKVVNLSGNRGFTMSDGTYTFTFLGKQTYGVTDVDTYWFGDYNIRTENKWNNSQEYEYSSGGRKGDSGLAFSWKNRSIKPGETLSFSTLIGIGKLNTPPTITLTSQMKNPYYQKDIMTLSGTVSDVDAGDIVTVRYAIDGGQEKIIGNNYRPNGGRVNYSANFQLPSSITGGQHYVEVWASDDKANMSGAIKKYFNVVIDSTAPTGSYSISPSTWTNGNVIITVKTTDTQTGVKNIQLPNGAIVNNNTTTYTVSENGNYLFYLEDNVGNRRQYNVQITNIDKTPPNVNITPQKCDWSKSINVNLQFTDINGSGFKYYKYAITDTQNMPSSWSNYNVNVNDTITINTEGEKYLHIMAEDKAGNVTTDIVAGRYLIDYTKPTIQVIGDLTNIKVDTLELNLQANDNLSGITIFKLDGEVIFNGLYTFTKNGTHTLEAIDKAGNVYTTQFDINNIYYECKAGLEHPIYSSTENKCPICNSYEGLAVIINNHIYNSEKQGVVFSNPKNAQIVEYYNEVNENPEKVAQYNYELKVIYNGIEYKTGVLGKYNITSKQISITDIVANDRIYNAKKIVTVGGGRLVGVCEGDNVQFYIPPIGTIENKNVGTHKVKIDEVKLVGTDEKNYILTQPEYGSIMVNITHKKAKVREIKSINRIYNQTNIVNIEGGKIKEIEDGDDVQFIIPPIGETESSEVGTHRVKINQITFIGNDIQNYIFEQPSYGDIIATISKEYGKIVIGCDNKKFDREKIEPYVVEKNTTSGVNYTFYKSGTKEEVDVPFDIGKYDVEAFAETDGNYTEAKSNLVTFEITKPDEPIINLKSKIIKINNKDINNNNPDNTIKYGDIVTIEINVSNIGIGSGYAKTIQVDIPEELEFMNDDELNKNEEWIEENKNTIKTNRFSFENNIENEMYPIDKNISIQKEKTEIKVENNKTVKLKLKVVGHNKEQKQIINKITVQQQDKRGDLVEYSEENKKYSINDLEMQYQFVDLKVEKRILQIRTTEKNVNKIKKYDIYQKPDKIIKLELPEDSIKNMKLTILYEINVSNVGNCNTHIEQILDVLPKGVSFNAENNNGWKIEKNSNLIYDKFDDYIRPNETKSVRLQLFYDLQKGGLSEIDNNVYILANKDLDEQLIVEGKLKIEDSNNYSDSKLVISIITGQAIIIYTCTILCGMLFIVIGISLIKRYVL